MNFECTWMPSAEHALEEILRSAADPPLLATLVKEFERHLAADPLSVGESRGHELERIAFVDGIALLYFVKSNEPTVVVYGVWKTG
jgi:hypothetical protein